MHLNKQGFIVYASDTYNHYVKVQICIRTEKELLCIIGKVFEYNQHLGTHQGVQAELSNFHKAFQAR